VPSGTIFFRLTLSVFEVLRETIQVISGTTQVISGTTHVVSGTTQVVSRGISSGCRENSSVLEVYEQIVK
jgi:hypothetical protein